MLEHKTKWGFKESQIKYMVSDDKMIRERISTDVY